jgi:hypothetical protein
VAGKVDMTEEEEFLTCFDSLTEFLDKLVDADGVDPNALDQALYAVVVMDLEDENMCPGCARVRIETLRGHLDRIEAKLPPTVHRH